MIVELSVENIAIIERSRLALGPGFTVLTGETGAGKSLLVDAIELVLGGRADTEIVRTGASRAVVSVTVDLRARPELIEQCIGLGFEPEDGMLYLQREVLAEGRSQARIAGRTAPIATLRQIGNILVDLHGQHDHQSLLNSETHLGFLDAWIGAEAFALRTTVSRQFEAAEVKRRNLAALQGSLRDREQRIDLLKYQLTEIESVSPAVGEVADLVSRLSRLKFGERLAEAVAAAKSDLRDAETNARDLLAGALARLEAVVRYDPAIESVLEPLRSAVVLAEDAVHGLTKYEDSLESDPGELEAVAGRLDVLKRLMRKYGDDEAAVLAYAQAIASELDLLADSEASTEALTQELGAAVAELRASCHSLTALRREKSEPFAALVVATLRELMMDNAQFAVNMARKEPGPDGADAVEFYFSANLGEDPKALSKIASGGEMSRVMLAIKTALAGKAGVPTLIFDEVDAGLSGRAAAAVGRLLRTLSTTYQVLVISHLPQIAARATVHFLIEKNEASGRVQTSVLRLEGDDRELEVARMLAGENVTPRALENARELLAPDG